jgi:hypothetical protein
LYRLQVSKVLVKDTIINTINKFNFKGWYEYNENWIRFYSKW